MMVSTILQIAGKSHNNRLMATLNALPNPRSTGICFFASLGSTGLALEPRSALLCWQWRCVERFWLEWEGSAEITDIEILVELKSERDEPLSEVLRLARLGTTTLDRTSEASVETPRCLAGSPSIIVKKAAGTVSGVRINLLQSGRLRVGEVVRYPLSISGPTNHSTGPARKAAQVR
jgi:hypothetical protein